MKVKKLNEIMIEMSLNSAIIFPFLKLNMQHPANKSKFVFNYCHFLSNKK